MQPAPLITLNGTSSAGKTTLLRALQAELSGPWLEAGLDKFLWMLPDRYLDRPLWDDVLGSAIAAGPVGNQLISGMHHAQAALARAGVPILADHVLAEPAWVRECAALFAPLPAYLIAVRCPLAVLEAREQARGDRTLGQARIQFPRVHAHGIYDLELDTSVLTPAECVAHIRTRIESGAPPTAWRTLLGGK